MSIRSKLGGTLKLALLGAGATVAATRMLRAKAGDLEPPLSGRQGAFRWRGMDVSFVEAGDPNDETVVLLHGMNVAGSGDEWRETFPLLAERYHVVAPDFPGFGCSDRPPLRYSAALYEDFVRDFLADFDEPRVVASSLSGAYVATAAARVDLADITLVCPTSVAAPGQPKSWLRGLIRTPVVGDAVFGLLTTRAAVRYLDAEHGYWDPTTAHGERMDYLWRTTHQSNARFAPASLLAGDLDSDTDLGSALSTVDVPVTLLWGREAHHPPLREGRDLAERANAELIVFDDAALLPHVEFPKQFAATVAGERPERGARPGPTE